MMLLAGRSLCNAQQVADTSYKPEITSPAYPYGSGPIVFIDEGHFNFHTKDGRYWTFANLLERDGYRVEAYKGSFVTDKLNQGKVLVISNALNERNVDNWYIPTYSAFTTEEITVVEQWVNQGGNLFLIADHMPMGGAAVDLARTFGFEFTDGFAFNASGQLPDHFALSTGLFESIITKGRTNNETVTRVGSFTGQAFDIPDEAIPILVLDDRFVNHLPDTAWVFDESTRKLSAESMYQGAFRTYGKGRIVVFGEAAMFSAQLAGPLKRKMGMNNPDADQNYKLLLNIIHWLDGLLDN